MKLFVASSAALVFFCPAPLLAQSIDAARHINAQGIEVIQGRSALKADPGGAPADRPQAGSVSTGSNKVAAVPAARASGSVENRLKVSASEQSARDENRLAILNDELRKESSGFETKLKVLQAKSTLSPDELARVEAGLIDHEKNLRSLNAEISRVRLQR